MSHSTWLRWLATVFKTASLPVLFHNFPWAAYSWSATYSLLLHQKWPLAKTVYTKFKFTCNAVWWAGNISSIFTETTRPASSYPEENVSLGYCRAEDLGGDCRSPTVSPGWAHFFKGRAPVQLGTLVFAWPSLIRPKVVQQQKRALHAVCSCEHSPLLYALHAPCCSCHTIILTFIADHCGTVWLFFLLLLLLCIALCWLQYCPCNQVIWFTAE